MYGDAVQHAKNCPQCTMFGSTSRVQKPPIPVNRIFKIVGVDILELPPTTQGDRYVVDFKDFLSNPEVATDSEASCGMFVPLFGLPEALLSDRGANMLFQYMKDL